MDPLGLALENFDGSGAFRLRENGVLIDASGELDGSPFEDAAGLGIAIQNGPAAAECLVSRLSSYARGREPARGERSWIAELQVGFAKDGYRLPDLMQRIASSEAFYMASAPKGTLVSKKEQPISLSMTVGGTEQ